MSLKKIKLLSVFLLLSFSSIAQTSIYRAPELSDPQSWSMILIPDVQSYVKFERNQAILDLMTSWIGEQIEPLNIQMVLGTGDLVEQA